MIRVLICDDAAEARTLLRTMLSAHPEMEVIGEAESGGEAVALTLELSPDVVVMDVAMPGMNGVEATRRLLELCPTVRVVAFAGSDDEDVVREMLEAGASAYCVKGAPLWELERSIVGAGLPLFRLAHALARVPSPPGVAQLVARELAELAGAALVATYLGAGAESLTLAGAAGSAAPDLGSAPGEAPALVREAFSSLEPKEGRPSDAAETLRLFGTAPGELLAVPLLADGEALGGLLVAMPANVLFTADPELVRAAADLAAAALASTRKHALTHAEARTDALTGLPNRRGFDEYLDGLLEQAGRRDPVSLALLDLDDFKQVNDRRGHGEGDRVLRTVARVLLRTTRADEEVFRVGGDEFALVVRGDEVAVSQALERIRQELSRQRRANGLPTLSAGIANVDRRGVRREALLEEADRALYAAKGAGKDRVVSSSAPVGTERQKKRRRLAGAGEPPVSDEQDRLAPEGHPLRVLIVDDDPGLRMLLRTTFEIIDIEVEEADAIETAEARLGSRVPDVLVLDVGLPGRDGLELCRRVRADEATAALPVVLLTGLGELTESDAEAAGANALLRKPFSPLELLSTIERLAGGLREGPFQLGADARPSEQLILYAQDLRRLLEIERSQRMLLQKAYEETAVALVGAVESRDFGTSAHSQRVRRYAIELTRSVDSALLDDPSLEYGFLLHDVGKIGVPDRILLKRGALTAAERRVMQTHAVVGEQMLRGVPLLQDEGLHVIRSHHERWDGDGYPDGLAGETIAIGARVFSVADALDAITSERPYRAARSWEEARREIGRESEHQFDPAVVDAFGRCERRLRRIYYELRTA